MFRQQALECNLSERVLLIDAPQPLDVRRIATLSTNCSITLQFCVTTDVSIPCLDHYPPVSLQYYINDMLWKKASTNSDCCSVPLLLRSICSKT